MIKSSDREQQLIAVHRYHDGSKHQFHRFAQSLGYLDWASQPRPFRRFAGAGAVPLNPRPDASQAWQPTPIPYRALYEQPGRDASAVSLASIGWFLRHALGLSAWKRYGTSRWSLRVNPSSGNLHPTEAYVVTGPLADADDAGAVWHYAPDRHELERRCAFDAGAWRALEGGGTGFLVALTSIHWRESWKYGERAFRYCQHDLGHAIAALRLAARLCGWRAGLLPGWPHDAIAAATGVDRDGDYIDAEREEPACVLAVGTFAAPPSPEPLVGRIVEGEWSGRASQLSEEHVVWTFIDEVASATRPPAWPPSAPGRSGHAPPAPPASPVAPGLSGRATSTPGPHEPDAAGIILQRRSAVAFDRTSSLSRAAFLGMLSRVVASGTPPWDALWWRPRIHLAMFVHRVDDLPRGLYLLARDPDARVRIQQAIGRQFEWASIDPALPLWRLHVGDYERLAQRVSCDQAIAADGFFSLGMIAEFDASLEQHGPAFYRHLFWESGVVGQVLYLEAEALGARATGIGCFFDDPVHEILGLSGHAFQSLYHFTVGAPVEDRRLTTEPGYPWEVQALRAPRSS